MVKQYVGARYVPKFASPVEWASNTSYEALTIVTFNNSSYTSKVPVPPTVGNPANNPQYWALTGNYNAQVEQYRQETETVSNNLTTEITNLKNADTTLQGNINSEASTRASADSNLQSQITRVSNNLTTLQGNINSETSTRASADSNLQSQINQIVAPSGEAPSAAEVQNARIGADGVTYSTLGDAIRGNDNELRNVLTLDGITFTDDKYLDSDGEIYDFNEFKATENYIPLFDDTFNKRRLLIKTYINKAAYVCYYDINKLLIQADTVEGSSATLYEGDTANVPNCAFVRVCSYKTRPVNILLAYPTNNNYNIISDAFQTFGNLFDYKNQNIQENKFLNGSTIIDLSNIAVSYPIPVQAGVEYKLTAPSTSFGTSTYIAQCDSVGTIQGARNYSIVNDVVTFKAYFTGYVLINIADKTLTPRSTIIFAESKVYDDIIKERSTYKGRLKGKKILYNGDSIAESRTGASANNGGGYPLLISQITGGLYSNRSVSGGTIAVSSGRHNICTDIANMPSEGDLVCLEGGINDYWTGVPLGTYDPDDFTGTVDNTTLCGAIEYMFRQAINKWVGVPIVFVIVHKVLDTSWTENSQGYTFAEAREKMLEICAKYSIPVLDMWSEGGLNGYMSALNTAYLNGGGVTQPDGCHPDVNGYKKYYVSRLIDLFERVLPYDEAYYS